MTTRPPGRNWPHRTFQIAIIAIALVSGSAAWVAADRQDVARLSSDTRVVVRFPVSVFSLLTQNDIREEFPILEQAGDIEVTGTAVATGRVSCEIEPLSAAEPGTDAVIQVHVVGVTTKSLVGRQSSVRIVGTGSGTFDAVKRIHFDGREFRAEPQIVVMATHETEIDDVETSVGGPFRLLASRKAREAIPLINELAVQRIKTRVGQRVNELVDSALAQLNEHHQIDEMIAALHPESDDWTIQVTAGDGFVQAALVPAGGSLPQLPEAAPSAVEVWMRLTATQRAGIRLFSQWDQSYRVLRRVVSEEDARRLAKEMTVSEVEDWTRVCVDARTIASRPA